MIVLGISLVFLSGCYFRPINKVGGLIDIKVFNEEGIEITGEFRDIFRDWEYFETLDSAQYHEAGRLVPLNSPAPQQFYYCVPGIENTSYTIRLTFINKNNYLFHHIVDDHQTMYSLNNCEYTQEGNTTTIDIEITSITPTNPYFHIDVIYFTKSTDEIEKFYYGSSIMSIGEENSNVSGCYFKFE